MPTLETAPGGVPVSLKWWRAAPLIGLALFSVRYASRPSDTSNTLQTVAASAVPLKLRAHKEGGDIDLSWNRSSPVVVGASSGILTISDGPNVRVIPLSGDQLREGRVVYTAMPQNDLTFSLEVSAANGVSSVESLQLLQWNVGPVQSAPLEPSRPAAPRNSKRRPARSSADRVSGEAPDLQAFESGPADRATPLPEPLHLALLPALPPEVNPLSSLPPRIVQSPIAQVQAPAVIQADPVPVAPAPSPAPPVSQLVAKAYAAPSSVRRVKPAISHEDAEALVTAGGPILVHVRVKIDASGNVTSADMVSLTGNLSHGGAHLKAAARSAAEKWKFLPATSNGMPVPSEMILTFSFR